MNQTDEDFEDSMSLAELRSMFTFVESAELVAGPDELVDDSLPNVITDVSSGRSNLGATPIDDFAEDLAFHGVQLAGANR